MSVSWSLISRTRAQAEKGLRGQSFATRDLLALAPGISSLLMVMVIVIAAICVNPMDRHQMISNFSWLCITTVGRTNFHCWNGGANRFCGHG